MHLLYEISEQGIKINMTTPNITYKVFKDNLGALEMATTYKFRPRIKHINIKLHYFRDYITNGDIIIKSIITTNQLVDYLTKPVAYDILVHLYKKVMGW